MTLTLFGACPWRLYQLPQEEQLSLSPWGLLQRVWWLKLDLAQTFEKLPRPEKPLQPCPKMYL